MGSALYEGLSAGFSPSTLTIYDRNPDKVKALGVTSPAKDFPTFIHGLDSLILAIKPQGLQHLDIDLSNLLIISVLAGVSVDTLERYTGSTRVVHAMPNLGVAYQAGYTGWFGSKGLTEQDRKQVDQLFSLLGTHSEVAEETHLHAITALAGSSPAYFFYLAEKLTEEGVALGFSEKDSLSLAKQVLIGSAHLLEKSTLTPEQWRQRVSSKGGITEVAVKTLKESGFDDAIHNAVIAAIAKSKEFEHHDA